ncbi:MAG: S8 family serine peptidase [Verrucomicrobiota bacterium]
MNLSSRAMIFRCLMGWLALTGMAAGARGADATRFEFREPRTTAYRLELPTTAETSTAKPAWVRARPERGPTNLVQFGSRVVLRLAAPEKLPALIAGSPLKLESTIRSNLFVLTAPDALTAVREAARLAQLPGVEVSHPIRRRALRLQGPYAPMPNDPFFPDQWHLEDRDPNTAAPVGFDLNVRAAWPVTRGEGIVVGVADDGIELAHPDLQANTANTNHWNFVTGQPDGSEASSVLMHGTAVAGLIAATGNNSIGVSGVAPGAQMASLVIWDSTGNIVDELGLMEMYSYHSNVIQVENHSWGSVGGYQSPVPDLEDAGIQNAVQNGRGGKGVVLARAAGNYRLDDGQGNACIGNGNDDGYPQDPREIAVAGVRPNGRAVSYTTPGANVLIAAFTGDYYVDTPDGGTTNYPNLFTTDRLGTEGYNTDLSNNPDYCFGDTGFNGTSGSTPQIAGLCALILAANPQLTYRDVQQLLILSARHLDLADPDIQTNGAGFRVSHNVGFGVPDAAQAMFLAKAWSNRPPATDITVTNDITAANPGGMTIPDDGLRVLITGTGVPASLQSIPSFPCDGLHPDQPTAVLPIVDVGQALQPLTQDLTGKAALIQRGVNYFAQKIGYAVAAGARFVIIYDNKNGNERIFMDGVDIQFYPVPTVFIDQNSGNALHRYLLSATNAQAQLKLNSVRFPLVVTNTLLCEHVKLNANIVHPARSDVRITLISPAGTRSVLAHWNYDTTDALGDWDYYSTLHHFESSYGTWYVEVSDEQPGNVGQVLGLGLTITGVPIKDTDHDGLDDDWEMARFNTLAYGPADNPALDGYNNMVKQILGWDPLRSAVPFQLDLSAWNPSLQRLSWPTSTNFQYQVFGSSDLGQPLTLLTNLPGQFPTTEYILPSAATGQRFYNVRQTQ